MSNLFDVVSGSRKPQGEKNSSAAITTSSLIKRCVGYHDTVSFVINDLSALLDLLETLVSAICNQKMASCWIAASKRTKGDRRLLRIHVSLTQPSKELLLELHRFLWRSHYRLIRVDTAYDFVLVNVEDLSEFRRFIEQRLRRSRTSEAPNQYEETSYLCGKPDEGKRPPPENIVVYEDKVSLFNDEPNVHVECRRHYKRNVANAGIHTLRDLALYNFDERMKGDLLLYEVSNKAKIGKLLLTEKQLRGKDPRKAGERAFNKTFELEQFMAQVIWRDYKDARKYLKPISIKPLLPVNAFGETLDATT